MRIGGHTWYYTVDPELRLIHAFRNCRAAKVAVKYNYGEEVKIVTPEDAEKLDLLLAQGYRVCHPCWKQEQGLAQKDRRPVRPGFRREPPK